MAWHVLNGNPFDFLEFFHETVVFLSKTTASESSESEVRWRTRSQNPLEKSVQFFLPFLSFKTQLSAESS